MPPRRSGNSSASMLSSSPSEASSSPASARPRHTLDRDDKTLRDMVLGYLFEPAFAFNYIVVLSWVPVRLFLLKELGSLPQADWLGLTREAQVYITLFLWGRYRWRTAITVEHFLYDLLMPLRVAVLLLAYFAWPRLAGWYGIALFVFAVLLKRPPFVPARSLVAVLRDAGAAETLADPSQPPQQVVLLYSPAASRSKAFLRSFHALSRRYSSENLRFYAMNVDADPSLAQRYNINLALFTKQVPTVMLFARGRAIDQLPLLLGGGNANSNSSGSGSDNNSSAVAKSAGRVRVLPLTAAGLEKEFALAARCEAVLSDCQEQ